SARAAAATRSMATMRMRFMVPSSTQHPEQGAEAAAPAAAEHRQDAAEPAAGVTAHEVLRHRARRQRADVGAAGRRRGRRRRLLLAAAEEAADALLDEVAGRFLGRAKERRARALRRALDEVEETHAHLRPVPIAAPAPR